MIASIGIATPKPEIQLIEQRLSAPFNCMQNRKTEMTKRDYIENSGNVFADLGVPRAEEALAHASRIAIQGVLIEIVRRIPKRSR